MLTSKIVHNREIISGNKLIKFKEKKCNFGLPKKGEWYQGGYMDFPMQAEFDIQNSYYILEVESETPYWIE